jgi:DNA modification methylase
MLKTYYETLEAKRNVNYLFPTSSSVNIQQIINGAITNFTTSLQYPIHRWYYYKEGFSPILVENLVKNIASKECIVIDPFCGGGTTPLVCMYKSIPSIGLEVNPFSSFLSKVKTRKYEKEDLISFQKHVEKIRNISGKPSIAGPKISLINKLFEPYILDELLLYKEYILSVSNDKIRDLLMFGWLAILEDLSNYRKAGNGLKLKSSLHRKVLLDKFLQRPTVVRDKLLAKYKIMLEDLRKSIQNQNISEPIIHDPSISALEMDSVIPEDSVFMSIFSPTYANCFDYCEIYKVELWMGDFVKSYSDLKILRQRSIRSHLNRELGNPTYRNHALEEILSHIHDKKLWDKKIPVMLRGYFEDMHQVFKAHLNVLKGGGKMVVVVGNSAYGGVVIPTDLIFCEIAESIGFEVIRIDVVRPEVTSSQQFKILKEKGINRYMRESVIYFEKP